GSYLAELLLAKGYEVHGLIRRSSTVNTGRIDHLYIDPHDPGARLFLHYGDLASASGMRQVLEQVEPDEVYNLAAQSHVRVSFDEPENTANVVAVGAVRLLDSVRHYAQRTRRPIRVYQAGTSEMFGAAPPPQNEQTPFYPRSPYAVSKVAAHWYAVNYREAYGLFICNGILFNHESPRRGETFVTRKITRAATRIREGLQDTLHLGNLAAYRDWGFAGDYVEAMWLMLQQSEPDDYVIATGTSHSVRDFVEEAFGLVGLDWREHVRIDTRYHRPTEVECMTGDARRAVAKFGWSPRIGFSELVRMMVESDRELARQERTLAEAGHVVAMRGVAST
ncbi:MAG: GDP-mannose 4,6-dehydratase, partial [Longimicrobiales bacterium]